MDEDKEEVLETLYNQHQAQCNLKDYENYRAKYLEVLSKNLMLNTENQKLLTKIEELESKINAFEKIFKAGNLNDDQIQLMAGRKVRNWSDDTLQKGLAFRFRMGRSLYNDLCKIAFLPSYNTLNRRIQNVEFDAGVSNSFCDYLKMKAENYQSIERHGGLILDECSILEGMIGM